MWGSLLSSGTLSTKSPFALTSLRQSASRRRVWHISLSLERSAPMLRYLDSAGDTGVRFSAPEIIIALHVVHLPLPPQSVIQSTPASCIRRSTGLEAAPADKAGSFTMISFCPKFSITIFTINDSVSRTFKWTNDLASRQ